MTELPDVVARYFAAHDQRDTEAALLSFASDATVTDDGHEYRGRDEIRDWLSRASAEFTYTRTLNDAQEVEHDRWLVTNHLEGNFPGGVVDLRYRVALTNGLISELEIRP
jgi:hypothetical protein